MSIHIFALLNGKVKFDVADALPYYFSAQNPVSLLKDPQLGRFGQRRRGK